jgi:starch synthase
VIKEHGWKMKGIVNGIDYKEWSPMHDQYLDTDGYTRYDMETLVEGKRQCKVREGGS